MLVATAMVQAEEASKNDGLRLPVSTLMEILAWAPLKRIGRVDEVEEPADEGTSLSRVETEMDGGGMLEGRGRFRASSVEQRPSKRRSPKVLRPEKPSSRGRVQASGWKAWSRKRQAREEEALDPITWSNSWSWA